MLKEMNIASGAVGIAEGKSNKSSTGRVLSAWGRKAVLAGMILSSTLLFSKAYSADANAGNVNPGAKAVSTMQRADRSQQLANAIAAQREIGISLDENELKFRFANGPENRLSYPEFSRIAEQLKNSGAIGTIRVYVFGLPKDGSRHLRDEIEKDGFASLRIEKRDLIKIIELAKTRLSYEEARMILRNGGKGKPIHLKISGNYPKGCEDYVKHLGRELYKRPFLALMYPNNGHQINTNIDTKMRGKLQGLAAAIVVSEYGDKEVTPEEAAIAINKWLSNIIIYAGMDENAFRSYYTSTDLIWHGCGVCTDAAGMLDLLCNSIGIPARVNFISNGSNWRHNIIGCGLHVITEVYLEGKGWVIFEPLNRCHYSDEYYTRETYYRILSRVMDYASPEDVIWNVSGPIKE